MQGHSDPRPLLPRAGCAGKSVKRPGKSPQAVSNCSNLCDSVCSLKCAYLESSFYSRYFVVAKRDGGLCSILDLRPINRALCKRPFRMISLEQILAHLKDAYFHIQIAPHHRRFLRFALEGTAYQYPVLLFGLALAPAHFLEVHGRSSSHPLRASGMRILNYLDDWLILAQSRDTPGNHIDKLLRHLEFLRLCVNMRKSILAPSQSNVSGSVLRLKAVEMRARPPDCLPCAFSNWAVYYTCARCSFG